jgi:CRISPR/Cas system-associated exonuclease Cas4 (RecB family)
VSVDLVALWNQCFIRAQEAEVNRHGVPTTEWKAGGRVSKANPNKEDGEWWAVNGQAMLDNFAAWWTANKDWKVWQVQPDEIGLEVALNVSFAGGTVPVKAYADFVGFDQDGEFCVVDYKSGVSMPPTAMQLGLYATMLESNFGKRPTRGYFYDVRKAVMVPVEGLDRWSKPLFDELFAQFAAGLEAEIFLPNVSMMCSSCGVKDFCYIVSGNIGADPLGEL